MHIQSDTQFEFNFHKKSGHLFVIKKSPIGEIRFGWCEFEATILTGPIYLLSYF